jgi:hypothetical protein
MAEGNIMPNETPRAKGASILGMIESLRRARGTDAVNALYSELPIELQEKLKYRGIVQSGWYPLDWLLKVLAAIKKITGGKREILRELANMTLKEALTKGVYKYARLIMSRKSILKRAPFFFNSYIYNAVMKITEVTNTGGRLQCSNCKGFNKDMWEAVIGSVQAVIEVHNGRIHSVAVHTGGGDGDDMIDLEMGFTWKIDMD